MVGVVLALVFRVSLPVVDVDVLQASQQQLRSKPDFNVLFVTQHTFISATDSF